MRPITSIRAIAVWAVLTSLLACQAPRERVSEVARGNVGWSEALLQEPAWYSTGEAIRIADNVLAYQRPCGGWGKIGDMAAVLSPDELLSIRTKNAEDGETYDSPACTRYSHRATSIDNGATHTQVRFLAKVYSASGDDRFKDGCLGGINYLLKAQYDSGGWPQSYPNLSGYGRHITFNDDAMTEVLSTLRAVGEGKAEFSFVTRRLRRKARSAVEKGIECILNCQVIVDGKRTAWCQQHDPHTLAPAGGRIYEKPSLCVRESVPVVRFLMGLDRPGPDVIEAVQGAVAWLDGVKLTGIRLEQMPDTEKDKLFTILIREDPEQKESSPMRYQGTGYDSVVVEDPTAPPIWARFYEIGTNRPIFCGWDGKIKYDYAQIDYERRMRYGWYGYYASGLLDREYPAWQERWVPGRNALAWEILD